MRLVLSRLLLSCRLLCAPVDRRQALATDDLGDQAQVCLVHIAALQAAIVAIVLEQALRRLRRALVVWLLGLLGQARLLGLIHDGVASALLIEETVAFE